MKYAGGLWFEEHRLRRYRTHCQRSRKQALFTVTDVRNHQKMLLSDFKITLSRWLIFVSESLESH